MPNTDTHVAISLQRIGKEHRELHVWIDAPEDKLAHHDLSRVAEFSRQIVAKFGEDAADEYVRHLQEDVRYRLTMIAKEPTISKEIAARVAEMHAFFGCAP